MVVWVGLISCHWNLRIETWRCTSHTAWTWWQGWLGWRTWCDVGSGCLENYNISGTWSFLGLGPLRPHRLPTQEIAGPMREILGDFKMIWYEYVFCTSWWWFHLFNFDPYLGKWSNLTNIFQMGWNHQLVIRSSWSLAMMIRSTFSHDSL